MEWVERVQIKAKGSQRNGCLLFYLLENEILLVFHKNFEELVIFMVVIFFLNMQETCDITDAISSKNQYEPYILLHGDYKRPVQAFLITDCRAVCEVNIHDIPLILMCAFFIYNIHYTKGCANVYLFLEHSILNITHKTLPPSVDYFLASLQAHT